MSSTIREAGLACLIPLLLVACAQGGPAASARGPEAAGDAVYACQMRGAAAEDRVYGPLADPSIDSALVRAQVTEACLNRQGQAGAARR